MRVRGGLFAVCLALSVASQAAVKTKAVDYKQDNTLLQGPSAWEDAVEVFREVFGS